MSHLIFTPAQAPQTIFGCDILGWIKKGGPSLDSSCHYEWQIDIDLSVNIYFGSAVQAKKRFPEEEVAGEFLAPPCEDVSGEIIIYPTGSLQETLAHEMFHALQLVAFKADPSLIDRQRQLWRRSKFPLYVYAHKGGPDEGAAEVWRAHQGHNDPEEPGILLALYSEWAEYFDAVIGHCW